MRNFGLRRIAAATVLAAALALAFPLSAQSPESSGRTQPSPPVEGRAEGQENHGQQVPAEFSVPVRIIEDPVEADRTKQREERAEQREADDLVAQQRAATAAERAADASESQRDAAWFQTTLVSIGTVALIWTLLLTRESVGLARKTAEAAIDAARVAEQGLALTQRAWIQVAATVAGPLRVSPNQIQITLDLNMTNTGQTPALRVWSHVKAYLATQATHDAAAEQLKMADRMANKTASRRGGDVVFPKQTIVQTVVASVSQDKIAAALAEYEPHPHTKVEIMVIGTVAYRLAFADETHQTGFIYKVVTIDPDQPLPSWLIDIAGGDISKERWRFSVMFGASPHID